MTDEAPKRKRGNPNWVKGCPPPNPAGTPNPAWVKGGPSPNPGGKTKGLRNRFSEAFVKALCEDFEGHGVETIERVRLEDPTNYVKVCVALMPKEVKVTSETDELTDDQLRERINQLRIALGPLLADAGVADAAGSAEEAARSEQAGAVQTLQ